MSYRNSNFGNRSSNRRGSSRRSLQPIHGGAAYLTTAQLSKYNINRFAKALDARTSMKKPVYGPERARQTLDGALVNTLGSTISLVPERPIRSRTTESRFNMQSPPESVDLYHKTKYRSMNPVAEELDFSVVDNQIVSNLAHNNLRSNVLSYEKRQVLRMQTKVAKRINKQWITVEGKQQYVHSMNEAMLYAREGYNSKDIRGDIQYVKRTRYNPLVPLTVGSKRRIVRVS